MTLLQTLDKFPPCLCRIVARHPKNTKYGSRLTLHEIAKKAQLSYGVVVRLSRQKTWFGATLEQAEKFSWACGVDLLHPARKTQYLKRTLQSPGGYKRLSECAGRQSPRAVLKMLKELYGHQRS